MKQVVFDAHCDTISKIANFGGNLYRNKYNIDIERAKGEGRGYAQVFAAFTDRENISKTPFEHACSLIDTYFDEINKNNNLISHCKSYKDVETAFETGKIAAMLAIEGGEVIEGKIENLENFYDLGVRVMTLTWNYDNEISGSVMSGSKKGLSGFGKTVVSKMNKMGMLIDVSHISCEGFWDTLETSQKPVAATHSNAYRITKHPRNLNDEQICALIKTDGFLGINFYSEFLSDTRCDAFNIAKHIEHILSLGGENILGFGSDFDGCETLPDGVYGVQDFWTVIDFLKEIGYSDEIIEKIAYKNFLRILRQTIN